MDYQGDILLIGIYVVRSKPHFSRAMILYDGNMRGAESALEQEIDRYLDEGYYINDEDRSAVAMTKGDSTIVFQITTNNPYYSERDVQ